MMSPAPILLGAILTILTAWALGRLLLKSLGIRLLRFEEDLFAILSGSACLSAIVFIICSLHLAYRSVFTIVTLIVCAAAAWRNALRPAAGKLPHLPGVWMYSFLIPVTVYTGLYFFYALAPESSPDGSAYHLGNVLRWWTGHGFVRYTGSMYANLSQGLEMLFLFAFSFGRHSSAALVHFAFLLMLPCLMLCYGRRFGAAPAFVLGAVLVYLSPVAGITGTSAYNDLAVACTLFGLFYILQIWDQSGEVRLLWIAGLLAGFAYALKYTAAIGILFAIGFVGWRLIRGKRRIWRPIAMLTVCASISVAPWMAKNWLWVGNPFSPFFNSLFPNRYIHISFEKALQASMALDSGIRSRWELPLLLSVSGQYVAGLFGPWLLLTPLAVVALRWKQGRRLLAAAAIFALPALTNTSTRFWLPFAVFAASALGLVLERHPRILQFLLVLHAIVSWPNVVGIYAHRYAWRLPAVPVAAALRLIPEEQYLRGRGIGYGMARAVEKLVPADARVFNVCSVPQAYTTRQVPKFFESAESEYIFRVLRVGFEPAFQLAREIKFRTPELRARAIRIVQTAPNGDLWRVSEMRVYRAGAEIPRQPSWRVTASPNPWEAYRAFDNNEATEWCTWRAIKSGMYLELDFDREISVDGVTLESATNPGRAAMRLEGRSADGSWRTLAAEVDITDRPIPHGLRRAAVEEIKARGFEYLVACRGQKPLAESRRALAYVGMTLLREEDGMSLYRLE